MMTTSRPRVSTPSRIGAWLLADVVLITAFAAIGRLSHGEDLGGLAGTAWPFLVGGLVGWLVARGWHHPAKLVPTGLAVWICTVVFGMLLRALAGQGVAISFVIVTTVVTGLFLLVPRAVAHLVRK